jgi:hypothetical protein
VSSGAWTPVVYGRTRRADQWWRALPPDMDREWARRAVTAATAGGVGLERGHRLLLAQSSQHRLVGGACYARDLSATMNSDGRRPLYCFVGWSSEWDAGWPDVPSLPELSESFVTWAADVYERCMRLDWDLHDSLVRQPRDSVAEPAPWSDPAPARVATAPPLPLGAAVAWPEDAGPAAWDLLRRSDDPGLLVTGWERVGDADPEPGTWIVSYDVAELTVLDAEAAPVESLGRERPAQPHRDEGDEIQVADDGDRGWDIGAPSRLPSRGIPRVGTGASGTDDFVSAAWSRVHEVPPAADTSALPGGREGGNADHGKAPRGLRGMIRRLLPEPEHSPHEPDADSGEARPPER